MHTKTIRLVYFLLGVSVGLPWYALFTASPYLLTRLDGWRLQPAFMSYLMLVSCISEASVLALASWTTTKVRVLVDHGIMRAISQFNASHRIRASISVFAITFPILAVSPSFTLSPSLFASLVTTIAILQSAGRAYLSVAIVTHASTYGPLAIHACISGQSTSGCLISTTQYIIALATAVGQRHSDSPDRRRPAEKGAIEASAIMFFGVATAFMVGILALHANVVSKMDVDWEYPRVASSENESLLSWEGSINETRATKCTTADKLNVAKINMAYNLAVGYVCMTSMYGHLARYSTSHSPGRSSFLYYCSATFSDLGRQPPINSDIVYFLILIAFGMSDGYAGALGMMAAPSLEHNPKLQRGQVDTAAAISAVSPWLPVVQPMYRRSHDTEVIFWF